MKVVCLIDTSIFCNVLKVPFRCQAHGQVMSLLQDLLRSRCGLLLPMTTILETGNHIAQCGDGHERWNAATRFVQQVRLAIEGKAPWQPMQLADPSLLA